MKYPKTELGIMICSSKFRQNQKQTQKYFNRQVFLEVFPYVKNAWFQFFIVDGIAEKNQKKHIRKKVNYTSQVFG